MSEILHAAISRALWEHSNFDADNGEYILPEDIRPPADEYDCCATVVMEVLRKFTWDVCTQCGTPACSEYCAIRHECRPVDNLSGPTCG